MFNLDKVIEAINRLAKAVEEATKTLNKIYNLKPEEIKK